MQNKSWFSKAYVSLQTSIHYAVLTSLYKRVTCLCWLSRKTI